MVVQIYKLSAHFSSTEIYRLTAQITRSAASVPANIAEGHAREIGKDYAHFLAIAKGSLMKTETFLMLAIRLSYLSANQTHETLSLITEISKMLTTLQNRILQSKNQ
ncbi:S23 ribosomal protein [Limnoraphis robusta CS-951]|uniref:S23 ribosomal protein n=2 Tax=Limnoraphis TaxID=1332112 RepID=A0A0F5YLH3_9CYAN|nr:S23 ribosomal protein [Limnoraphis robusta CS-951]